MPMFSPCFPCFVFSANKSRRVDLSTASLLKVAPTDEERKIVHSLFLNTLDTKYDYNLHPTAGAKSKVVF